MSSLFLSSLHKEAEEKQDNKAFFPGQRRLRYLSSLSSPLFPQPEVGPENPLFAEDLRSRTRDFLHLVRSAGPTPSRASLKKLQSEAEAIWMLAIELEEITLTEDFGSKSLLWIEEDEAVSWVRESAALMGPSAHEMLSINLIAIWALWRDAVAREAVDALLPVFKFHDAAALQAEAAARVVSFPSERSRTVPALLSFWERQLNGSSALSRKKHGALLNTQQDNFPPEDDPHGARAEALLSLISLLGRNEMETKEGEKGEKEEKGEEGKWRSRFMSILRTHYPTSLPAWERSHLYRLGFLYQEPRWARDFVADAYAGRAAAPIVARWISERTLSEMLRWFASGKDNWSRTQLPGILAIAADREDIQLNRRLVKQLLQSSFPETRLAVLRRLSRL